MVKCERCGSGGHGPKREARFADLCCIPCISGSCEGFVESLIGFATRQRIIGTEFVVGLVVLTEICCFSLGKLKV